jgi:hypothetical protein
MKRKMPKLNENDGGNTQDDTKAVSMLERDPGDGEGKGIGKKEVGRENGGGGSG